MQLNSIGRDAGLTVQKVKHADAFYLDRNVRRLKAGSRGKPGVEFIPRVRNARQEWTACANACGRRNFRDHGQATGVLKYQVIVRIAFKLELRQRGTDDPLRGFQRRHAIIGRNGIGGSWRPHGRDSCIGGRIQVDQADISVSPCLY